MLSLGLVQLLIFVNVVIVTISQTFCGSNSGDRCCFNDTDCSGQHFSPSTSVADFYAHGYKSGFNASLINMGASNNIFCYGSFSCLQIKANNAGLMNCEGSNSCSSAQLLTLKGSIYNDGANSISNTTISTQGNTIACYGEQSCAYSTILSPRNLYGHGSYALIGSDIISNFSSISFSLAGFYAGYGAIFTCQSGHTCNIYCAYRSCNGLTINCNGICNINNIDNLTDAPISNSTAIEIHTNSLLYNSLEITSNNDALCSTSAVFVADNYDNNNPSTYAGINITSNDTPICCRGYRSCQYALSIMTNESVVCSGLYSCYSITNIMSASGLFCEGAGSCDSSSITSKQAIYCMGSDSCGSTTILTTPLLYCSGWWSCHDSYVFPASNHDFTAYFNGWKSGDKAIIYCNSTTSCSIFCGAAGSCGQLTIFCGNQCDVECNQLTGCPEIITMHPTIDPTINPTLEPTINPTINPTLMPSQEVKDKIYLITFEIDQNLETEEINSVITEALIVYCNVNIISTVITEDRKVMMELKVIKCGLDNDFIEKEIETKLEEEYKEPIDIKVKQISVDNDDNDDNNDESNNDKSKEYVIVIVIVSVAVLVCLGIIISLMIHRKKCKKGKSGQHDNEYITEQQIELNTHGNDANHIVNEKDDYMKTNDEDVVEAINKTDIGFTQNRNDDVIEIVNKTKKEEDTENEIVKSVNKTYGNQQDDAIVSAINKTADSEEYNKEENEEEGQTTNGWYNPKNDPNITGI